MQSYIEVEGSRLAPRLYGLYERVPQLPYSGAM